MRSSNCYASPHPLSVFHTSTVIPLEIWDCPSNVTQDTLGAPLSQFSTIIFVIDIQAREESTVRCITADIGCDHRNYTNQRSQSSSTLGSPRTRKTLACISRCLCIRRIHSRKSTRSVSECGLSLCTPFLTRIHIAENFRHIQQRVLDELLDISVEYEQIPINFHLTSIYDHSLHEAFSKVLHKLIDSLPYLEDLLNVFTAVRKFATYVPRRSVDLARAEHTSVESVPIRFSIQVICGHRCITCRSADTQSMQRLSANAELVWPSLSVSPVSQAYMPWRSDTGTLSGLNPQVHQDTVSSTTHQRHQHLNPPTSLHHKPPPHHAPPHHPPRHFSPRGLYLSLPHSPMSRPRGRNTRVSSTPVPLRPSRPPQPAPVRRSRTI